jgi:hypothetical protein
MLLLLLLLLLGMKDMGWKGGQCGTVWAGNQLGMLMCMLMMTLTGSSSSSSSGAVQQVMPAALFHQGLVLLPLMMSS